MNTLINLGKPLVYLMLLLLPLAASASPTAVSAFTSQEQDDKREKKQDSKKAVNEEKADAERVQNQPEVKQVPKARKQSRPTAINTPKIKVKPIKIIRPKIKKP